jgi:hypothetical protein
LASASISKRNVLSEIPRKEKGPALRGAKFVSWEKTSNRGRNECNPSHVPCGCRNVTPAMQSFHTKIGGGPDSSRKSAQPIDENEGYA